MKRTLAGLACAAALALASCGTTTMITVGQADAVSWSAIDAASVALDKLVKAGVTTKAENQTIAKDLPKLVAAMTAADAAYTAGTTGTATAQITAAAALLADLTIILTNHGVTAPAATS
jgi:hypothetical protein